MINAAPPRPLFRTSVGFAVSKEDLRSRVDRTSLFALALLPWPMKSEAEIGYANHGVRLRSRNDGVAGLNLSERNGRCFTGGKVQGSTREKFEARVKTLGFGKVRRRSGGIRKSYGQRFNQPIRRVENSCSLGQSRRRNRGPCSLLPLFSEWSLAKSGSEYQAAHRRG
jgi:hypothetical protein